MDSIFSIVEKYLENTSEYIVVHQNSIIIYANKATCDALGLHQFEIIGRHYRDFALPGYENLAQKIVTDLTNGIVNNAHYIKFLSKSGKPIYVLAKTFSVMPPNRDYPNIVFTGRDVTQQFNQALVIIDLLPEQERKTLIMDIQGRLTKEIAAELEITENTVSTYKRRFKDRLEIVDYDEFTLILREILLNNSTCE